MSETSFVLGPAHIACGDGSTVYGRVAVEHGRVVNVLTDEGPSDLMPPEGSTIAPGLFNSTRRWATAFEHRNEPVRTTSMNSLRPGT